MGNFEQPKVTVIVAVYNQERFIGRCLRSLLHQTMQQSDYEIIVVNDGSTDLTKFAVELFCDQRKSIVKIISNETNLGLPASLNKGILKARSEYVVRVDSDDFVNVNFLNLLHLYLETNPDKDAVACDYLLLDDKENVLERSNCIEKPIACGIMFRKKQLVKIGMYDEKFLFHEERELRIRFEKKHTINRLEIPLYRYRRHEGNMTNDFEALDIHQKKLVRKHKLKIKS